eukprot:2822325-Pyramimonas_sp.AAC.1
MGATKEGPEGEVKGGSFFKTGHSLEHHSGSYRGIPGGRRRARRGPRFLGAEGATREGPQGGAGVCFFKAAKMMGIARMRIFSSRDSGPPGTRTAEGVQPRPPSHKKRFRSFR